MTRFRIVTQREQIIEAISSGVAACSDEAAIDPDETIISVEEVPPEPPLKRVVVVLEVEVEDGIDKELVDRVPTVKGVVLARGSSPEIERILRDEDRVDLMTPVDWAEKNLRAGQDTGGTVAGLMRVYGLPMKDADMAMQDAYVRIHGRMIQAANAELPDRFFCDECGARIPEGSKTMEGKWHETSCSLFAESVAPTIEERITDEMFIDDEPGTVPEEWYKRVLDEVRGAAAYLRNESVWRVEYNIRWGQTERVTWVEADSEAEVCGDEKLPLVIDTYAATQTQVKILSCRRVGSDEDIREYVEALAEEQRWPESLR